MRLRECLWRVAAALWIGTVFAGYLAAMGNALLREAPAYTGQSASAAAGTAEAEAATTRESPRVRREVPC